jgi:purine-binding chemotaxis protein CheW
VTGDRLSDLRHTFDAAFTFPPVRPPDDLTDLLAVTVDGSPLAVPLQAMSGLVADRALTPLPASPPQLLGVAGLRGQLVPVFSLAGLVGRAAPDGPAPRWLVLAAGSPVFAVAVDSVDGHLRVPADAIARPAAADSSHSTVVRTAHGPRPVVDMPAIRATVTAVVTRHAAAHRET